MDWLSRGRVGSCESTLILKPHLHFIAPSFQCGFSPESIYVFFFFTVSFTAHRKDTLPHTESLFWGLRSQLPACSEISKSYTHSSTNMKEWIFTPLHFFFLFHAIQPECRSSSGTVPMESQDLLIFVWFLKWERGSCVLKRDEHSPHSSALFVKFNNWLSVWTAQWNPQWMSELVRTLAIIHKDTSEEDIFLFWRAKLCCFLAFFCFCFLDEYLEINRTFLPLTLDVDFREHRQSWLSSVSLSLSFVA